MHCNSKTMRELHQRHSTAFQLSSLCSILHMETAGSVRSALQVLRWRPPLHHLPLPLTKWHDYMRQTVGNVFKCLCTQMAQQPLPWKSETTQRVRESWQSLNSSLFRSDSYGILPMRKHLPTKNPWAMCSKLILSESCSNEFVQRKDRLNNQGHVISGHCMIQFSLKQSQSNTNMGFREFCFVLNPLSIMTKVFPVFSVDLQVHRRQLSKFRRTRAQEPSCWTRPPFTMFCLSQADPHRYPLSLSWRKVFQLARGVLKNPQPEKNRCIVWRVKTWRLQRTF